MKRFCLVAILGFLFGIPVYAQVPGQPYQIPAGYEGYSAGTLITYGGANYVIQDNGTMLLADTSDEDPDDGSVDETAYQIPADCGCGEPSWHSDRIQRSQLRDPGQ